MRETEEGQRRRVYARKKHPSLTENELARRRNWPSEGEQVEDVLSALIEQVVRTGRMIQFKHSTICPHPVVG